MPSIEIVSIGQKEPIDLSNFLLVVGSETELLSHGDNPKSQYPDSAIMILADRTDVLKQRSDLHHR